MNILKKISLGAIIIALMAAGVPSSFANHISPQPHNMINIQQHMVNTQQNILNTHTNNVVTTQQHKMTKTRIIITKIKTIITNTKTRIKKLLANTNTKIKKLVASRFFHRNKNNLSTTSNTALSVNTATITATSATSTAPRTAEITAANSETLPTPHFDINYSSPNSDPPFIRKINWTIHFRHSAYLASQDGYFPPTYFSPECLFFNHWYRATGTPITHLWFFNKCIYQVEY